MTEAEALTRWCPFVRAAANLWKPDGDQHFETGFNRIIDAGDEALADMNCIGSRCMAWRWTGSHELGSTPQECGTDGRCGLMSQ